MDSRWGARSTDAAPRRRFWVCNTDQQESEAGSRFLKLFQRLETVSKEDSAAVRNPFRRPAPSSPATSRDGDDARLNQAVDAIEAAASVEDAFAILVATARQVIGCDGITLVARDGDSVEYMTEDAISPLWTGRRFPIRVCVSGQALLARSPIAIPDIAADKRVPLNAYLATFVRSMAVVPIGHEDPRHALGAYWQATQSIAPVAIDRMTRLAAAVAAVIDRTAADDGRRVA